MKNIALFLSFLLLVSCSVQKRKYQTGYYVDWHSKNRQQSGTEKLSSKTKSDQKTITAVSVATGEPKELLSASADNSEFVTDLVKKSVRQSNESDSCDVLIFKDGSEIRVRILDINLTEVKYKKCDSPDGPNYVNRKSELFMVKYADGRREVLRVESPEPMKTPVKKTYRANDTYKRENHPLAIASLVLGIAALVLGYAALLSLLMAFYFSIGFYILPLIAGVLAVITGVTALKRIREQPDVFKGKGMAVPGLIFGLAVAGIYLILAFLLVLFSGI